MFTIAFIRWTHLKSGLFFFKIGSVFQGFAMRWQSRGYEIQGKTGVKITGESAAICVKSPRILHGVTAQSASESDVKWLELHGKGIEMRASKPWNGFARWRKRGFCFYLGVEKSVKNEEGSWQKLMHNAQCMMHNLDREWGAEKVAFCFNS